MTKSMKVSDEILKLVPYKAGKPIAETQREYGVEKVYKLASNENPLGPSPHALAVINDAAQALHRYPDPAGFELIRAVAKHWNLPPNWISIGNGSNEVIDLLIRIYCAPGEFILQSAASFVAYAVCAQAARVRIQNIPLLPGFKTDIEGITQRLRERKEADSIRLVFIANPNNPTGTYVGWNQVDLYLKEFGNDPNVLTVFDEAYVEFVRASDYRSLMPEVQKYSSVAILRTFSKVHGLAGLRVGVLVAAPEVIDLYNRVRNPFNINEIGGKAATAALGDHDFMQKSVEHTWKSLDYFYEELNRLKLPFVPSQGNFVLFETKRDVRLLHEALLRRGIILRPVGNYGFNTLMRMSVGLEVENKAAVKALEEALKEVPELPPRDWAALMPSKNLEGLKPTPVPSGSGG